MTGDVQLAETSRVGSMIYVYSCLWKGCERKGVMGDAQLAETIRVGFVIYCMYILVFGRDVRGRD